jgi:hypothetical protein
VVDVGGNIRIKLFFLKMPCIMHADPINAFGRHLSVCQNRMRIYGFHWNRFGARCGACLGCAVRTANGMRRVCKTDPSLMLRRCSCEQIGNGIFGR